MKNSIQTFPIADYATSPLDSAHLSSIKTHSSWLFPQASALLGSVIQLRGDEKTGLIDPILTLQTTVDLAKDNKLYFSGFSVTKDILKGLFNIFTYHPRSAVLKGKMTDPSVIRYSSGVPLILAALKEYKNVKYMDWDWNNPGMKYFLDEGIIELIPYIGKPHEWSNEDLLKFRVEGNPKGVDYVSMYAVQGIANPEFRKLPRLMKLMLCQVWCYHPTIRHKYMITNLMDLDSTTEPLVTSEIFEKTDENDPWN